MRYGPVVAALVVALAGAALAGEQPPGAGVAATPRPAEERARTPAPGERVVLFVCEHGSVKSLIAAEWFNRRARERGLDLRATSRGLSPDLAVPAAIVEGLRRDGFDVAGFKPRRLAEQDLAGALRRVRYVKRPDVEQALPWNCKAAW